MSEMDEPQPIDETSQSDITENEDESEGKEPEHDEESEHDTEPEREKEPEQDKEPEKEPEKESEKEPEKTPREPEQKEEMPNIQTTSPTPPVEERETVPKPVEGENTDLKPPDELDRSPYVESSPMQMEELEQEVRYRDTVLWSVRILEQSVNELEAQLEMVQNDENDEESEFKLRCEAQTSLNTKLEEQITWYNQEVMKMRERTKKGNEPKFDDDLEAMSEYELAQLAKQLERERNNLYGDLRNKSWLLDNHSKEYYHYKELIKTYTGDLSHINRSLEQIWRQRSKSRGSGTRSIGGMTPMISPGLLNWNGESGIRPSHRIIDPRKGPIRKTAGVRSLPRLDQKALAEYDAIDYGKKKRTRSMSHARTRTKSLEVKRERHRNNVQAEHRSADELDRDTMESSAATSVEPASEFSEDLTVESFTSSIN